MKIMHFLVPFALVAFTNLSAADAGGASTSNPNGAPRGQTPSGTSREAYATPDTPATTGQHTTATQNASSPSTGGSVHDANWHNSSSGSGGSLYNDPNWPNTKKR